MIDHIISVYLLWISIMLAATGLLRQTFLLFRRTIPEMQTDIQGQIVGTDNGRPANKIKLYFRKHDPLLFITSIIFHSVLIFLPFFVLAHAELFYISWGIRLPSLPENISDIFTVIFIFTAAVLVMRRLFISDLRKLTKPGDYILLAFCILPFLSGYLAYHGIFAYRPLIYIHIVSSEILLVLAGWTRLGHAVFFMIARFAVSGEYSFRKTGRSW